MPEEMKMPNYRRFRVPGGTYFFTVNLLERRLDLLVRHIDLLREAVRVTRCERPFHIGAWVVLPDHMHCVWTLPPGDDDFSTRWKAIKIRFVQKIPAVERRSKVRANKGERAIWQRRFWEHAIRNEQIMQPTSTLAIGIRSNMVWWNGQPIGRILLSIAMFATAYCRKIGQAALSLIWLAVSVIELLGELPGMAADCLTASALRGIKR
jgi:REP element-mobilizing transposase RayT